MAMLRRRSGSPVPPSVTLLLDQVLDGPRPGRGDAARDAAWMALRSALGRAEIGTAFDPRAGMDLHGAERTLWALRRRAWAADLFADDSRVEVR